MKRLVFLAIAALGLTPAASAISVGCTVTSGTVLTSTLGGLGYSIANGIGTSTGGATGTINCPSITTGIGFLTNYAVFATVSYQNGPVGTSSGTTVREVISLAGGSLNGSSAIADISGGNTPVGVVPPVPFQIGSTLSGSPTYLGFTVNVASSVTAGGPVGGSSGQVFVSYDVSTAPPPTGVPEPSTYALMSAGIAGIGFIARRRRN